MNYRKFWFKNFSFGCLALLLFAFLSCGEDSGLGGAIDTKSPTLSIDYPPSGAAIRDSFVLFGNVSDDKSIDKVLVSIRNLEMDGISDDYTATVSEDSKSWSIELNRHDDLASDYFNGWQYPDGKYEVYVTAYDHAGNNSGKSSRSFEIDNTAPVFIISNPGVVKKSGLSPSAYGSIFTIDGTISDNHAISFMDVKIFNSNGELISFESYEGENIDFYREEEIATAGGTSVQIAQAGNVLNSRYSQLHPSDSGTEFYYAQITLTDSAKVYKNPPAASSRSAEDLKSDALGNSTSKIYLYDDVYTSVMSAKKGINSKNGGFSAANLKDILAGVEKGAVESQALEILNEKAIDTSAPADSDSMANKLSFSLNPEANPTYNVNGFSFFNADDSIQSASSGNTVSVTISAGLDGTNIAPEKVRVWMKAFDEKPGDSEKIKGDLRNLEKKVEALEKSDSVFQDAIHKSEDSPATLVKTEEKENDWLLIYDYSLNNSKGSSVATKTFSVTLPDGISLSKYYILGVTGCDIEDVEFAQNTVYGFVGNTAGVPPTITFDSPDNLSVWADFEKPEFSGSATLSTTSLYVTELTAVMSISDETTKEQLGEFSDTITCRIENDEKIWTHSEAGALTWDSENDGWHLNAAKLPGLAELYGNKAVSGTYWLATLKVTGKSSSGHPGESSQSIHIDTVAPVVTLTSVTPAVSGAEYFGGTDTDTYLNGIITIKGNVEEQNLLDDESAVSYDVLASTDGSQPVSILSGLIEKKDELGVDFDGKLGKQYSLSIPFDTNAITGYFGGTDRKIEIELLVTATDKAGNKGTYSSKTLNGGKNYIIYQETDRPKIDLGNADVSITKAENVKVNHNLFGTKSNNRLTVNFSDDDSIAEYEVYVYDEKGALVKEAELSAQSDGIKANPYKYNSKKTTASLSYVLPSKEAKYQIEIKARDYLSTGLNNPYGEKSVGKFFVAVDSGAPEVEISSPASGSFQSGTISISGSVSKAVNSLEGTLKKSSDDSVVAQLKLGSSDITQDSAKLYSWEWVPSPSVKDDGGYTIDVKVTDIYGQTGTKARTFKVDTVAPVISNAKTSVTLVKLDETDYITLNADVTDVSGDKKLSDVAGISVVKYYLSKEEKALGKASFGSDSKWTQMNQGTTNDKNVTGFNASVAVKTFAETDDYFDGKAYFYVAAEDNVGNFSIIKTPVEITLDKTAPKITVKDFDGIKEIEDKGVGTATKADDSFSVTVIDTNPVSLASSDSTVTVGSGTKDTEGLTFSVTPVWKVTETENGVKRYEESKNVTFTAGDANSRTSTKTVTLKCDNWAPRVTLGDYDSNTSSNSIELKGEVKDANISDSAEYLKVYLVPVASGYDDKNGAVTFTKIAGGYSYAANFSGLSDIKYNIAIIAKDSFGNESKYSTDASKTAEKTGTSNVNKLTGGLISIDSVAPTSNVNLSTDGKLLDRQKKTATDENPHVLTFGSSYYTNKTFTLGGTITETNLVVTDADIAECAKEGKTVFKPTLKVSKEGGTPTEVPINLGANDGNGNYEWSYKPDYAVDGTADGLYEYTLTLWDKSKQSFSKTVTVVLDTKAPAVSVTSPAAGESFESSPIAKIAYSDDGVGINTTEGSDAVTYTVKDITDSTDIKTVDSSKYGISNGSATGTLTFKNTFDSEGSFTITAKVKDYLGYEATSETRTFYYDRAKPVVKETLVGANGVQTNAESITLKGIVYDTNALFDNGAAGTIKISDGERTVNAVLTKKAITVDGKDYLEKQYAEWEYTFYTAKKSDADTNAENYLPDGTYNFAIIATDVAGKTNQISRTVTVDTVAPAFGTGTASATNTTDVAPYVSTDKYSEKNGVKWYRTADLRVEGTATDKINGVDGTGIKGVYYQTGTLSGTSYTWSEKKTSFAGSTSWSGTIEGFISNNTKIRVIVEDNAGNVSEPVELGPYNIDTKEPELNGSVEAGKTAESLKAVSNLYVNGESDLVIRFGVTDGSGDSSSGVDRVYISPYAKIETVTGLTPQTPVENKFTVTVEKNDLSTGTIFARIYDYAGNYSDVNLLTTTLDNEDPKIPSISLVDKNTSFKAYTSTEDGNGNQIYYVHGADSHKFTLSGIATDNFGITSIEYKLGDAEPVKKTQTEFSWTFDDLSLTQNVDLTVTVTDNAERTAVKKLVIKQDNDSPLVSASTFPSGYAASNVVLEGTLSDTNLSAAAESFKVWLVPDSSETGVTVKEGVITLTAGTDSTSWKASVSSLNDGVTYNVAIVATDALGNISRYSSNAAKTIAQTGEDTSAAAVKTIESSFTIDTDAPKLAEAIKIGTAENPSAGIPEDGFFINNNSSIYIKGKLTDGTASGVKSACYKLYDSITVNEDTKTADGTPIAIDDDGSFSITIDKDSIKDTNDTKKSGAINVVYFDNVGNYQKEILVNFTYDATDPKIQSATIDDTMPNFKAYENGKDTSNNRKFFINNDASHKFAISGVATDNLGLKEVKLELTGAKIVTESESGSDTKTDTFTITDSDKLANWKFENLDLSGITSGVVATITVTDKAGNKAAQKLALTVDKIAPAAKHEYDAKKKDLYFRIGEFDNDLDEIKNLVTGATALDNDLDKDVGGKYAAGTWGTASTITIRGYWTETDSGVKTIYYKILNPTATTEDALKTEISTAATDFAANYATTSDGNFAPQASPVQKRVVYTQTLADAGNTQTTATIPSDEEKANLAYFKQAIPGFNAEKNYLLLVAVDNVGNAAIDALGATKKSDVTNEVTDWNSGLAAFSLNVDTVAPSLTSTTTGSQYTNKVSAIIVSAASNGTAAGTVTDSSSGVKSVVLTIDGIKDSNNKLIEVKAELSGKEGDSERSWKATIPTSVLSKLNDSSKSYNVNATVRDIAGNKSSPSIFTLQVDTESPKVSMVTPAYVKAANTTALTKVNGRISLKGKTTYKGAAPNRFALYYTTEAPTAGTTLEALAASAIKLDGSNAESSNEITDLNDITSWTYSNFDSYVVFGDDTTSAAKDIYIIPVVYDDAGNCSIYSEAVNGEEVTRTYSYTEGTNYFKYSVDKNSDRPIITLGNCNTSGTALKSTSKAYGTIEDDDGLDGLKLFYIKQSDYDNEATHVLPGTDGTTWTEAPLTSGSWEIDSGAEGYFAYYLYAIDAEGTHFWSKAGSETNHLNQMYIYNGVNDKTEKKNENTGLSFSADLNPPEIESLEIAHEKLAADAAEGWSAVTETFGPDEKNLYIKLVVSEAIGLTENESPASTDLKDKLAIPEVKIDGQTLSSVELESVNSESKTKTLNGNSYATTYYTFLFKAIDLSGLNIIGSKTAKVIVTDKSGFTGQGTIGVNYDNNAPTIKIISPTATISDAVIAATTIKGTAFDDYSSIKMLEYVIPLKSENYTDASENWVTIPSTTATWDIEFDSGSTESPSSLLYYAADEQNATAEKPGLYKGIKEVAEGLGIYRVPLYFRTTDTVGNKKIYTTDAAGEPLYYVYVNPDGGKPSAWINAPETGLTTSGSVTIYGGAMDNISVATVGIQIDADGNGVIEEADYTYLNEHKADFGISTTDADALVASTTDSAGTSKNDWYIKAEGTNSWKVMLKTSAIADYSGDTKTITYTDSGVSKTLDLTKSSTETKYKYLIVRVRAIDGEGNTRKYTNENYVVIDNSAPSFSNVKLVQFGKNGTASFGGTPVTEREYVSGMYISNITATNNGTWYLSCDVKSKSAITSILSEKQSSESTAVIDLSSDGISSFVKKESESVTKNHAEAGTISDTDTSAGITSYYKLLVPLKTTESGMIYAMLKSNNDANSTGEQTIKINIDSTAPSLFTTGGAEKSNATTSANLRVKSQNKILGKDLDKNSVIENSDGYFTLGDTVKEAGSGLAWLAFYFENDIKNRIYDPLTKVSGSTYGETEISTTATNGKVYINEDNLAALYLTGVTRNSETTLTLTAENAHVRKGSLVKIAGTYRTITDISGTEVTFTPAVSTTFTTVEVIYAQVVDHTVTENIITDYNEEDIGTERIESDDGDGMCESLTQQGTYFNWSAMIDSNNIPDGTTYIRVVAMDNAGNLSHGKIASMVANNRPRLTKVFIGTDLNGNGKFDFDADEGDAPVVSTSNKLRTKSGTSFGEFNYYTAYNTRSGAAQSKVTLDSSKFKVIDGLCIVPEFTGGNGSLKYTLTNGTDLTPYTDGALESMIPRTSSTATKKTMEKKSDTDTDYYINNVGTLSLFGNTAITDGDNKNAVTYGITDSTSGTSYKDFGGIVIKDDSANSVIHSTTDGEVKNVKVTFFDNTDSTNGAAHKDGQWATVVIPVTIKSNDSEVPVPKITPFYWKDSTENSLYVKKNGTVYEAAPATEKSGVIAGHIELEGALPEDTNLTADLPKVSGIIKIEGTIYDDVRLSAIGMKVFGSSITTVAEYTNGSWVTKSSLPTGLVSFKAVDEDMSQNGHTVKYYAVINTETLSVSGYPVGKSQWVLVTANDWKNNYITGSDSQLSKYTGGNAAFTGGSSSTTGIAQTAAGAETPLYKMDVVPYVTEIVTHLNSFYGTAHSVYARTARGHYPCYEGEEIEFVGYNLGTGKAKVVIPGMATAGTTLSSSNKVTLTKTSAGSTGATSGVISVSVNGIPAMNNINKNNACGSYVSDKEGRAYTDDNYAYCYNRQPNGVNNNTLTDDLELDVWQFKNAAKPVNGGAERVTMKINPVNGTPGFSYANSVLYFSMPGKNADTNDGDKKGCNNATMNGQYASQIPFCENYGGFSHNSFTFDSNGYSYGAAMCTDTQNAMSSAFFQFFSKETPIPFHWYNQNMNYANQANSSRLDSSTVNVGTTSSPNWQCNINRIQSISMDASVNNGLTYVYIAYYDAVTKQVRFRWGTVGAYSDSIDGKNNNAESFGTRPSKAYGLNDVVNENYTGYAQSGKGDGGCRPSADDSFVKYSNTNHDGIPVQVIAGSGLSYSGTHNRIYAKKDYTAGQYVSLSILGKDTASPTAVVFWYDGSKLMMAYNSSPTTGKSWTYKTVDTDGGLHVKSCVDSDGGIHLAYYTANGGNLKYAYLSGVTATPQVATVDANGAVGTKCTIDIAKNAAGNQVPYITYQMIGGVYTYNAKIAYRTNFDSSLTKVPDGADSKDMFTGDWEVSVIPTESTRLLNDDTINVGLRRDSSGNAIAFTSNAYWKKDDKWFTYTSANYNSFAEVTEENAIGVVTHSNTMDVGNPSLIYGNNTANPIVGYGIESGAIEIAQKK